MLDKINGVFELFGSTLLVMVRTGSIAQDL